MDRVLLKGALAELFDEGAARFDASMAELTTFRIGGPADVLVEPRTAGEAYWRHVAAWALRCV